MFIYIYTYLEWYPSLMGLGDHKDNHPFEGSTISDKPKCIACFPELFCWSLHRAQPSRKNRDQTRFGYPKAAQEMRSSATRRWGCTQTCLSHGCTFKKVGFPRPGLGLSFLRPVFWGWFLRETKRTILHFGGSPILRRRMKLIQTGGPKSKSLVSKRSYFAFCLPFTKGPFRGFPNLLAVCDSAECLFDAAKILWGRGKEGEGPTETTQPPNPSSDQNRPKPTKTDRDTDRDPETPTPRDRGPLGRSSKKRSPVATRWPSSSSCGSLASTIQSTCLNSARARRLESGWGQPRAEKHG